MIHLIPGLIVGLLLAIALPAQAARDIDYDWMLSSIDVLLGQFASTFYYPLAGPNVDNDGNGIREEDTLAMLSSVLRGNTAENRLGSLDQGMVNTILNDFNYNRGQVNDDLKAEGTNCTLADLAGYPCRLTEILQMDGILPAGQGALLANLLLDFMGGLTTVADTPGTFVFINSYIDAIIDAFKNDLDPSLRGLVDGLKGDIHLDSGRYRRYGNNGNMANRFGPAGTIDANATTNLAEYAAVGRNREAWLNACHIVPSIHVTGHPQGGNFAVGDVVDMPVTIAGGSSPFSFQWQDTQHFLDEDFPSNFGLLNIANGNGITGANSQTLHFDYMLLSHSGLKPWVRISDPVTIWNSGIEGANFGGRTSLFTEISVDWRNWGIYRQPSGSYAHPGGTLTTWFGVWGGLGVPTYQWYKDGTAITGQTTRTLTITNAQLSDQGTYYCIATNGSDLRSNDAFFSVQPPMQVVTHPDGGNMKAGDPFTFEVEVTGGHAPLKYQWRRANLNSAPGAGANVGPDSATYAITSLSGGQQGSYSCVVTDASYSQTAESVTSNATNLTVLAFMASPVPQEVQPGYAAVFEVMVQQGSGYTGSTPNSAYEYSYEWFVEVPAPPPATDPLVYPLGVSGVTANQRANFAVPSALQGYYPAGSEGNYFCRVYDEANVELDSARASLKVVTNPIVFTIQPSGARKYVGESHTFTCIASGGTGTLLYEWTKDGVSLNTPSSSAILLNIPTISMSDQALYRCRIWDDNHTDSASAAPSSAAYLEVAEPLEVTDEPDDAELYVGDTYTPSIGISGGLGTQQFQWYKGTSPLTDGTLPSGAVVSGASTATLSVAGLTLGDADKYRCDVWDDRGIARTSDFAWLGVNEPLTITDQPDSTTVLRGQTYTFTLATAGGAGTLHYQWKIDGVDLPAAKNQDAASFSIVAAKDTDAGAYTCVVTDVNGTSATSDAATLFVNVPFALVIQPVGADLYYGGNHQLTVSAEGAVGEKHYQWFFDPEGDTARGPIVDATESVYDLNSVNAEDAGVYDVEVSDDNTTLTSNPALVVVSARMTLVEGPQSTSTTVGGTAQFSVDVTGGLPPVAYQWQKSDDDVTYYDLVNVPDTEALTITDADFNDQAYYRCVITDSLDTIVTDSARLDVSYGTPVAGPVALGIVSLALALSGAVASRRKRQ